MTGIFEGIIATSQNISHMCKLKLRSSDPEMDVTIADGTG